MLTRRRALLISAVTSGAKPDYSMEVVSSLVIHQSTSDTISTEWYVAKGFESDGTFTLTNPSKSMLSYSSTGTFNNLFLQRYCIQGASSGSTMYYFPAGCTATHTHDETAGTYTITVTGRIQVYTMNEIAFTYTGQYTDSRVDGVGDVTLNTSGTLTVTSGTATVSVYMLAGGGGGCYSRNYIGGSSGGGGGNETITTTLEAGHAYEIIIGTGGKTVKDSDYVEAAPSGGDTTAFYVTVTGGTGGSVNYSSYTEGIGGTPNGGNGATGNTGQIIVKGGTPNGGGFTTGKNTSNRDPSNVTNGGDGLVRITFS